MPRTEVLHEAKEEQASKSEEVREGDRFVTEEREDPDYRGILLTTFRIFPQDVGRTWVERKH